MLFESFWMNKKKIVVCSQQLNYLTCTFEPKYNWAHQYFYSSKARAKQDHCVQKNGVSARSLLKFQLDDRAKGSDMKHWKMLFEAFSSTHITSHTLTKSLNNVQVYYYHQSSIRKGGIFRKVSLRYYYSNFWILWKKKSCPTEHKFLNFSP